LCGDYAAGLQHKQLDQADDRGGLRESLIDGLLQQFCANK